MIIHREYSSDKDFATKVKDLGFISYTDGSTIELKVRQMEYKERKQSLIKGYADLIIQCVHHGVNSVGQ